MCFLSLMHNPLEDLAGWKLVEFMSHPMILQSFYVPRVLLKCAVDFTWISFACVQNYGC